MEIRKIKPEERIDASKIQAIAFLSSRDFQSASTEPEKFQKGYETCRAVFNEDGKMCSCLELIPYEIRFDGHTVKMAGIGGVASLPEERRNGYIRGLFRSIFEEMRDNDQIFSYLYPFSNPYYRQYGYELGLSCIKATIPTSSFKHFPKAGSIQFYLPGMDRTPIINLYNAFIKDKNLAVVRNEKQWDNWLGKDPYKTNQYVYIWYSTEGIPESYIIFEVKRKDGSRPDMMVKELIWSDQRALKGILGFMSHFASHFEHFIWDSTQLLNVSLLFPEPYDVKREIVCCGMNRIVDLQKVLSLKKYPADEGKIVLDVTDDFLPWNTNTYEVKWNAQGAVVKTTQAAPDLHCSIQAMTQLVTGYAGIDELVSCGDIVIYSNKELLSSVFTKKPLYLTDRF